MRLQIIVLLIAVCSTPLHAMVNANEETIWLEPLTYQQMREMRDRAMQMAPKSTKKERPSGAGQAERKTAGKDGVKKRSWGGGGQRLRRIYVRSGSFPAKQRVMMSGRMSTRQSGKMETGQMAGGQMQKMKTGRMAGAQPSKMESGQMVGGQMHKMEAGQMSGGQPRKMESNASGSGIWLERPDNTIQGFEVKQRRSSFRAEYSADDGGWYRIFAYNDLGVRDNRRVYLYSYYSFMSHGDEVGEKSPQPVRRQGYYAGKPEFELVRIYADGEGRYRNYVGQKIRVRALFQGKPVVGKRMVLSTVQGWRQVQTTDANGDALFTLIKEDFHEDGFDRRKSELYLLRMEHRTGTMGEYLGTSFDGERHIATLPFRVSPARDEWQIQYLAYLVAMVTIVGAAVAIAIRRRRRRQR
ncbi:MAG: DUF4198 domain-containing protein [Gammaproteobacteria bacterium]|nr:DUF4198 domain-containing protein [Gammaproteobacteria bacterium]